MRRLLVPVGAVIVSYCGICIYLYLIQDHLIFYPNSAVGVLFDDSIEAYEIQVDQDKNYWTRGYIVNANAAGPIVVYFGGNGAESAYQARAFQQLGVPVVLTNYRGYGRSDGSPSEQAILGDAQKIIEWIKTSFPGRPLVLMGYSLGSGVAAISARTGIDGVILISPYQSLVEIAHTNPVYRLFPVKWLMKHQFDTRPFLGELPSKVLIIYSRSDHMRPLEDSLAFISLVPHGQTMELNVDHDSLVTQFQTISGIRSWLREQFSEGRI